MVSARSAPGARLEAVDGPLDGTHGDALAKLKIGPGELQAGRLVLDELLMESAGARPP